MMTDRDSTSTSVVDSEGRLLKKVLEVVEREKLVTGMSETQKVVDFHHPQHLQKLLQLEIRREGRTLTEAQEVLEKVVQYSVKTQHPHFYNQLYAGIDEVALTGAWLTEALNTNQHTFEVAPVFIMVEHFVISKLVELFGWQQGDGIFSPGGSMSNMYGLVLARYRAHPEVKRRGNSSTRPLVILTSDQSHYSIKKAAAWAGLGTDNVVLVQTDSLGRMLPQALKEAVKEARRSGGDPFFVNATAGSTVFGAFDPLEEVADVCEEEGLWLHVDACWGGTAILSRTYSHLLQGIHRADSISWNPHKMLGVSLQCSPFIVKHQGLLHEANSASASYLFQQDKFYDTSYDTGDKSFQCGRKVDAFKLYLVMSLHGLDELERRVDAAFSASRYLYDQVLARPGFRPVLDRCQCTNTCFWYIPPSLRGQPETQEWWEKLSKVAPELKTRMIKAGSMMIGYQPVKEKGLVNFVRMINTCVPAPTNQHMEQVLDQLEALGADL
ncbi:cysteine sulfinic acid decarboxylase-like isoform X2 [Homarus americanus]|uniref:cysteine sulfinic acid decarboxylase-like isoform X2 n=1 Tax=Homarus americanus TaxID=6706 RepID=UPI001C45FF51|nr:cysteine sulfinic acid decarboxylase-like isoform X2 [Homarus americanus]